MPVQGSYRIGFSAAADCGSAVIVSQTDADALSACPTITGDVIIATNAAGAIKLNGVQSIEGNLISKQCFPGESPIFDMIEYSPHDQVSNLVRSGCFGLLSLSSSTLVSVSQNITLQNLLNITTISLPALETIGTHFYLDGLPILTKLAIPKLSSVGGFHLAYAPALLSINLDGLTHLSSVYINSVGLLSMPAIDVKTKITSFVVGGVPNMPVISVWTPYIGLLQVNGNGFTTMATYNLVTKVDIKAIDTFSVSGCGVLSGVEGDVPITNENFIATGNSFQSLNLASWTTNGSTYIQGNPQLKSIEWNFNTHVMDTFVIRDNPLLNDFTSFEVQNVSSLVLVGSFDTEIL